MAIQKPILDVASARTRQDVKVFVAKTTSWDPTTSFERYYIPEDSIRVRVVSVPDPALSIPSIRYYEFAAETDGIGEGFCINFTVTQAGNFYFDIYSPGTNGYAVGDTITFTEEQLVEIASVRVGAGPLVLEVTEKLYPVSESNDPEREGQLVIYRKTQDEAGTIYIAVEIDDELTWKPVEIAPVYYDQRTGEPWNPLAGFYSNLVDYER